MEKRRISIYVLILIFVFILGFLTSRLDIIPTGRIIENSGNQYKNSQNSLMDNSEKRTLINRIIHIDNGNVEKIPTDYLNDDDILVYNDKVILKINNAQISNYESDSMYPFLGEGANGIVVKPVSEKEVKVGDIITFRRMNKLIVHRVVEKGIDERGVYFITKGDNSDFVDDKLRFEEIEHKLIGIIY